MWQTSDPKPQKLIAGLLGADVHCLEAACDALEKQFGEIDLRSDVWDFEYTAYYRDEIGPTILRQFISFTKLVNPGELAQIKHDTNTLEEGLAIILNKGYPRPINIDPGLIEPGKLVLATTKNYCHRVYIGKQMWAEVTLIYEKGAWKTMPYTYPDYRDSKYHQFFEKVRHRLLEQLKSETSH